MTTRQKFGTFLGVFTPSVLTILGLVMYLRFGWVVGNVGLGLTLVIVVLASSITLITALSASAIATNMRVGAGGEYYMISHSLGLELGGAIGIPLFLCRTLSITFYSFGLAESVIFLWPAHRGPLPEYAVQLVAAAVIVLITLVASKSAAVALKAQVPIMVAVGLSVVALAVGVFGGELRAPEWSPSFRSTDGGFWYVFAVFFPAVTGFAAGIGMSGDLEDPRRSIPRGTLWAVGTGTAVYLVVPVLLSITAKLSPEQLAAAGVETWTEVAVFGGLLIYPGIWGAILSSAIGSVLGGPRVLQALASDGLAPRFLARLSPTGQPTVATWMSGAIALSAVALGGLNAVAQFVTILFLTLYILINLAAGIEKLVGDPSYRPTIHVPWWLSMLGALGTLVVMFLISPLACGLALVLETVLYLLLRQRALQKQWGDVRAGLWVAVARFALIKLRRHKSDPRNWRPHILLFTRDSAAQLPLARLACDFHHDRGVVTACKLVFGNLEEDWLDVADQRQQMDRIFEDAGLTVFSEVNMVADFERGAIDVTQANGFAGLQSNTIMFEWANNRDLRISQLRIMRAVAQAGKSTILARLDPSRNIRRERIDLWWGGLQNNGDMMLLLAYLLRLSGDWKNARLVVHSVVSSEEERQAMQENLAKLIPETRIQAETELVIRRPGEKVAEIIHRRSHRADLVFLGLMEPPPGTEGEYADRLAELAEGLKTTIFVRNAGEFAGNLI